jgi:hypothetical protein
MLVGARLFIEHATKSARGAKRTTNLFIIHSLKKLKNNSGEDTSTPDVELR